MEATPLLEAMSDRVQREREAVLASARDEAARIQQEARDTGEARRQRALAVLEAELADAATRERQRAEAEAHMRILTTKDTVADEVLDDVGRRLAALAQSPAFADLLPPLLRELLDGAPDDVVVLVPPDHEEHCRQWVQEHGGGRAVVADPALRDGIAIQDEGPTFRITNTLSTRLARRKDALRKHCIARLFPDGPGGA